ADHVIDLGPDGGSRGGHIIATGTPEHIAHAEGSHTGHYLRKLLAAQRGPASSGTRHTPAAA
ncbi:MAG: excinuclease subunit, partial [Actinomycetia bacterium]|nr:excinuclease subunit [Actinomycetes bacterium]MDX6339509.1 excinuclease subunit [Streptosporangiaceae bacterium]